MRRTHLKCKVSLLNPTRFYRASVAFLLNFSSYPDMLNPDRQLKMYFRGVHEDAKNRIRAFVF